MLNGLLIIGTPVVDTNIEQMMTNALYVAGQILTFIPNALGLWTDNAILQISFGLGLLGLVVGMAWALIASFGGKKKRR